jgi:formate hydrogenlyase subunit 3/multisubunit Na+/H+ antiporter MnhD subunit
MSHQNPVSSAAANVIAMFTASMTVAANTCVGRIERRMGERERGDVPGWVLITLMTAGLVTILWTLAGTQLATLFNRAMSSVSGPGAP